MESANAFEEDGWMKIKIGPFIFQVRNHNMVTVTS